MVSEQDFPTSPPPDRQDAARLNPPSLQSPESSQELLTVIERARYGLLDMKEIAQVANRDYGIRIERTEDHFPEDEWTWYHEAGEGDEPDTVYILEKDLKEKSGTHNLALLFHEVIGGHRKFSAVKAMPERYFSNKSLWHLMEMEEDPWVNQRTLEQYPLTRYLFSELYSDMFGLKPESGARSFAAPEMSREHLVNFAMLPLHLQYVYNMIYRWHRSLDNPEIVPNHPGITDERVTALSEQTWPEFQKTLSVPITPRDGTPDAWREAVAENERIRMGIVAQEIEPDYIKLVEESRKEYKDRKKKQEKEKEQKKQSEGSQKDGEEKEEDEEGKEKKDGEAGKGQTGGSGKSDEEIEQEAEQEFEQIEDDLQKRFQPKLKPVTKKEIEEAEKRKEEEKAKKQGEKEKDVEGVREYLQDFHPENPPDETDPYEEKKREDRLARYQAILSLPETVAQIDDLTARADALLQEKRRGLTDRYRRPRDLRTGLEEGAMIDESIAHQVVWGDTHVFATEERDREKRQGMRNYCVTWVVDVSGSENWEIEGGNPNLPDQRKITHLLQGLIVGVEGLNKLNVPQQLIAFNAGLYTLWNFDEPLDDDIRAQLATVSELVQTPLAGWNNDGYALDEATRLNFQRQLQTGEHGLTIYLADGLPAPDADHAGPEYDLQHIIDTVSLEARSDLIGAGIGPGTEHVEDFFKQTPDSAVRRTGRHIRNITDFSPVLSDLLLQRLFS